MDSSRLVPFRLLYRLLRGLLKLDNVWFFIILFIWFFCFLHRLFCFVDTLSLVSLFVNFRLLFNRQMLVRLSCCFPGRWFVWLMIYFSWFLLFFVCKDWIGCTSSALCWICQVDTNSRRRTARCSGRIHSIFFGVIDAIGILFFFACLTWAFLCFFNGFLLF